MAVGQGVGGTEPVLSPLMILESLEQGRSRHRSHPAGFPWKRANCTGNGPDGTRGEGAGAPRDSGDFHFVHPCRVKSFRKAVSAVMDELGK